VASLILGAFRQKRQEIEQRRGAVDDTFGYEIGRVVSDASLLMFLLSMDVKNCCINCTSSLKKVKG